MAWAALSAGVLLGLASVAVAPVRAQEAGATNAPSATVATAYLDYQEVKYTVNSWIAPFVGNDSVG